MITVEDRRRFESLNSMFAEPGWKTLAEEMDFVINALKETLVNHKVPYEMTQFQRGRIAALRDIQGYPQLIDQALKEKEEVDESEVV